MIVVDRTYRPDLIPSCPVRTLPDPTRITAQVQGIRNDSDKYSYGDESKPRVYHFSKEGKTEVKSDISTLHATVVWRNTHGILAEYSRNTNFTSSRTHLMECVRKLHSK